MLKTDTLKRPPFPLANHTALLSSPIQYLKGVGPHKAAVLQKLGIVTLEELLFYFPRDHQDRRIKPIQLAQLGEKMAIRGEVLNFSIRQIGKRLGQGRALIKDQSAMIEALWFKQLNFKYDVFGKLKKDVEIPGDKIIYGQVVASGSTLALRVEHLESYNPEWGETIHTNGIVPAYPLTEGLNEHWFRDLAHRVVMQYARTLTDPLPNAVVGKEKLPFQEAVSKFHFPASWEERDLARERLAFDEFFLLELALEISRHNLKKNNNGLPCLPTKIFLTHFKNQLGYEFTKSQTRVINDIFRDMARPSPMNRLLQGDVGSGKTVVALSAALLAIENGTQAAFLAPTEILASQHQLTIQQFLQHLPIKSALLTRSTPAKERSHILKELEEGQIQLLIGTHAILSEKVKFHKLGFIVIDEQHRFGVRQRARLVNKTLQTKDSPRAGGEEPHVLIMTATPIPRTLAMTLYGDLDVSILDELPKGRKPIHTRSVTEEEAMRAIHNTARAGEQVYVVFPLIEESDALTKKNGTVVRSAKKEFETLKNIFHDIPMGLIHGQMDFQEKAKIMSDFRSGRIQILVATPVVEVGMDFPNATLMVIMNPERFGLAQLHQLRGRVGRGTAESQCLLVPKEDTQNQRLLIFCQTTDGFQLAEEDLKLRGPGEILGEAQHGVPFFKVGDLIKDSFIIAHAKDMAKKLVYGEISLTLKEFDTLNITLKKLYGNTLNYTRVG